MDAGRRTPPSVSAWHRGKPGSGGPARPGLGAPRPPRPCPPPRAAPPQRRRSVSGPGASGARPPPAPASPPEASAAPSILGNSLISLGSGGGIPLLIWRFRPRLRESGGRARGARTRSPGCRQDARAPARPRAARARGFVAGRAGGTETAGNTRVAPAPPAAASRAERPPLPLALPASPPCPRRGRVPAAPQPRMRRSFPGAGSAPRVGAARSRKRESLGLRSSAGRVLLRPLPPRAAELSPPHQTGADPGAPRRPHATESGALLKPEPWAPHGRSPRWLGCDGK